MKTLKTLSVFFVTSGVMSSYAQGQVELDDLAAIPRGRVSDLRNRYEAQTNVSPQESPVSPRKQTTFGSPVNRAICAKESRPSSLPANSAVTSEDEPHQNIPASSIAAEGKDYLSILPAEISEQVFQHLPSADLIRLSYTGRELKEKVNSFASFSALTSASNPFQYIYQKLYSDRDFQTKTALTSETIADKNKKQLHPLIQKRLRHLDFSYISGGKIISYLRTHQHIGDLQTIYIHANKESPKLTVGEIVALRTFLLRHKRLDTLDLLGQQIDDKAIAALVPLLPRLKRISLAEHQLTKKGLEILFSHLSPNIEELSIWKGSDDSFPNTDLLPLAQKMKSFTKLTKLDISGFNPHSETLTLLLSNLPKSIKELYLRELGLASRGQFNVMLRQAEQLAAFTREQRTGKSKMDISLAQAKALRVKENKLSPAIKFSYLSESLNNLKDLTLLDLSQNDLDFQELDYMVKHLEGLPLQWKEFNLGFNSLKVKSEEDEATLNRLKALIPATAINLEDQI
ncbi:hypothetical protein [Candidatus Odyssella thessalonicensis]|uniref:hypothetical protein n=1 Tax=Candidatus Odyssella thessalonicensis TaxID=84647 RepID=UPI000225A8D7|nr:hypothetical protein [Candidatus Odyssella thessalonicensis]